MFSQVSVCPQLEGAHTLRHADTQADAPKDGYCSRRYASYWNTFLLSKLRKGYVFLCFHRCLSVHSWRVHTPYGMQTLRQTPPKMATAADGTHHTGIHSCYPISLPSVYDYNLIQLFGLSILFSMWYLPLY